MGEGQHLAQAGSTVAVKTRDVPVPVVGDVLLGFQQALCGGGACIMGRVRKALEPVVCIAVGVGRRRGGAVVRREGDLGDVAVVACRGAGLLRGGVAKGLGEYGFLTPIFCGGDTCGPAVDVVAESKRNPAHVFAWAGQKR